MDRVTINIEGMMCKNCEKHVNEAVKKACPSAEKISSSHEKGTTEFVTGVTPDKDVITAAVEECGYTVTGFSTEPYVKKGLFGR